MVSLASLPGFSRPRSATSFLKRLARLVIAIGWTAASLLAADATTPATERSVAAFALAFGRLPAAGEANVETGDAAPALAEQFARHRARIAGDAALQREVVVAAARDGLGCAPVVGELRAFPSRGATYAALLELHVARLAANPAEYAVVVDRAYRRVLGRAADPLEFEYWKRRPAVSFVLLVGCIENWARRNSPGLTVTSGTPSISVNSALLSTFRLSPAVAAEARAAVGLPALGERPLANELGCVVVAPGAADLASVGGVHFLAVDSGALRAN